MNTKQISNRKFGIELEFVGTIAGVANATGAQFEGYNHNLRNHWKVVTDGSVPMGGELVSPPLSGEAGITEAKEITAKAGSVAKVDRSCGFHVHVDASDLTLRDMQNVLKLWLRYEDTVDTVLAPSRRGNANTYCKSNFSPFTGMAPRNSAEGEAFTREAFKTINACASINDLVSTMFGATPGYRRYHKLNFQSFYRHGTIEFRCHQGTLDADKVEMWVRFCVYLVEAARKLSRVDAIKDNGKFGAARLATLWDIDAKSVPSGIRACFAKRQKDLNPALAA